MDFNEVLGVVGFQNQSSIQADYSAIMKPIVENDISGDRDWRSIHEFLGVSPYEKPCSAMPRKIRKSRKKLVKFADDEATVREAGGDDEMNLVENMKDSQPLQTVPEASMTGSVVKKESNLEMEELDEKFEEVDAVVSAIGEMDAEAETFEDDRGNSAGDGITENKISNLDKLGENASLVSDVVGEANDMTVEIHLHAEVAAGNLNYSGENILERGKSLDTCELENVAVNNECETEDNSESDSGGVEGDVDMAGTSQGNCKNGEGIEIADAAVDDNSLKGEEKGELGYANDAGDTDDSSLHLDNTGIERLFSSSLVFNERVESSCFLNVRHCVSSGCLKSCLYFCRKFVDISL